MTSMELAYRSAAAGGGLAPLISLFDTLAGDLRRTAEAERENDISRRSREASHALQVLAFLEDRLSHGGGGELAQHLTSLYRGVRSRIIIGQAKRSAEILESAMADVLKVREILQGVELQPAPAAPEILPPEHGQQRPSPFAPMPPERSGLSWSA